MNTRYFTSRLLALMLAALLVFSCAAAEETEIPSGVVDNFVQSEIEKQQSAGDATAFEAGAAAGEYYADFTFGGVQTLSGITTTLSLYANLPKYAKPVSAVLRLSYTASDLILTDISSLTYYMNGHAVRLVEDCHAFRRRADRAVCERPGGAAHDGL